MKTKKQLVKLTQYSHGAGCGCKISLKILEDILKSNIELEANSNLLVGNHTRDDAAVYDVGNGQAVISTTDFFMPIVDDAFDFGQIASVNAISDVYAMGGRPMMAIAILGWPVNELEAELAQQVLEGSRTVCKEAGISLAGGHSIDSPEPIFGLAVTGTVATRHLKRNDTAVAGCKLFLTKPLGVGILTTAQKKGVLRPEHFELAKESMLKLNDLGYELGKLNYVKALTDVTGFGLLGHLLEMCEASNLSAVVAFDKVPKFEMLDEYLKQKCIPGGTSRNWDSYSHKINELTDHQRNILCDPQTSGGLLIAVEPEKEDIFLKFTNNLGYALTAFGYLVGEEEVLIRVK